MSLPQYARHEVSLDGRAVHLSPLETEMVATLLVASPYGVSYETLIECMWPDPDLSPLTIKTCVSVHVARLRNKGVPIERNWGRGLAIPEEHRGGPLAPAPRFRERRLRDYSGGIQCSQDC
jgi:DNA-binding response OmpR family regulator